MYPKIHFKIIRAVNPLSQLYINQKFHRYIFFTSIYPCHRASFIKSLFIAYKSDEWFHFVVLIGSPALILFIACVSFLSISVFFLIIFVESATCWSIDLSLSILIIGVVPRILRWVFRGGLLQPYLVYDVTDLVRLRKKF